MSLRTLFCVSRWFAIASILLFVSPRLWAGDLEWSGLYRIEGNSIENTLLDSTNGKRKEYGVHTLILRPKIVAADGLYINGQLNIFNDLGGTQRGAVWGDGVGTGTPTDSSNSNSASESQDQSDLKVSQFYLTLVQEHGALIAGRAPLQFGLGMTHNAGRGLYDHYADTRDIVGYKFMAGNVFIFPMYAKISEGDISGYDDIKEINIQMQYENTETDTEMGVFYQNRQATDTGNDMPDAAIGGASPADGQYNAKNFNIYYKKATDSYSVGVEVSQQSGNTGVKDTNGADIDLSGFGMASEFEWHPEGKKSSWGFKAGFATGDDPTTTDEFEGFIFDRNYDVAMLLFNHALGQQDMFHTALVGRTATSVNDDADIEAISNVYYVSPFVKYKVNDKWQWVLNITAGYLAEDTYLVGASEFKADTNLGYELDLALDYHLSDRIQWTNQFGYLSSGAAWEVDGNFDSDDAYGFVTKAAVSF